MINLADLLYCSNQYVKYVRLVAIFKCRLGGAGTIVICLDESSLRNMRLYYLQYQKRAALRPELPWTHYRIIIRIEEAAAR
jgi:hypothetical protein